MKTPLLFSTAPLGFTRHCDTGQRHPKVTPFSRVYAYAPVSQFLFFSFTSSPLFHKLLIHSEIRVKGWGKNLHPGVHPLPNAIAQVRRVSRPLPEGSQCTENKAPNRRCRSEGDGEGTASKVFTLIAL